MSGPNKYHQSATPEPYESAPTSIGLTSDEYKALTNKRITMEERYNEAVSRHEEWKAAKAKGAWAAKLEVLRQQELEKEKEQLWLEAEEKQWKLDLKQKELEEATDVLGNGK
ncbi:hypothetical protein EV421DRAFT_1913101 [Armillaria borealis]|uniref:Uncharacterized protein n=1 Tax=Armillaria borealis TaxID=47425 RepID=A0AA39ITN0_9AGAR|nr:hypothetical protein EV421DRAFT_1913101 [Armillaria borealis]